MILLLVCHPQALWLTEKENPHPLNLEIDVENGSSGVDVLERLDSWVTYEINCSMQ